MVIEEWKSLDFIDCPNYEISNIGRVRNKKTNRYLKGFLNREKHPYRQVVVGDINNKPKALRVCRLVALAFVENPDSENKIFVDHIDGNSLNDVCTNLRWVTRKENNNNPITRQRLSESHKGHTPWNKGKKTGPWKNPMSEEGRRNISNGHKKRNQHQNEIQ